MLRQLHLRKRSRQLSFDVATKRRWQFQQELSGVGLQHKVARPVGQEVQDLFQSTHVLLACLAREVIAELPVGEVTPTR
jgi:hypothetical protein